MKKILTTITTFLLSVSTVSAQLTNPVVTGELGDDSAGAKSGATFASYFVSLWSTIIGLGAIVVLIFFIWGAFEWITSGGDKGKLETARNRITQAVIGLIILVSSYVIIGFIGDVFFDKSFNILQPSLPNVLR